MLEELICKEVENLQEDEDEEYDYYNEEPLEDEEDFEYEEDDGKRNISAAYYSIAPTNLQAFEMEYDLRMVEGSATGSIEVGLGEKDGNSFLNMMFDRGSGRPVRCTVSIVNKRRSDLTARERVAMALEYDKVYRIKVRYEPTEYIRLAILDQAGTKLWDTGEMPTYGAATFDRVSFGIRRSAGDGSSLSWDAEKKAMRVVGASKPDETIIGYVDNVKVSSFKR